MSPRPRHLRPFSRFALAWLVAGVLPAAALAFARDDTPAAEAAKAEGDAAAEMLDIAEKAAPAQAVKAEVAVKPVKVEEDAAAEMLGIAAKAAEDGQAAKAAGVANGPEPDEKQLQPFIQQFTPQFRPLVRSELHLIVTACQPTREQRAAIARDGDRVFKDAVREFALTQFKIRNGRWDGNTKQPDGQAKIREGFEASVKAHLSAEQAALYKKEAEARAAHFRSVTIRNLVSILDRELSLNNDQRAELVESLGQNYDPKWCDNLQFFLYDNNNFPMIPDNLVVPFLDPSQKAAWAKKPKSNVSYSNFFGIMGDTALEDEEPADGAAAEAKPVGARASGDDPT